MSCPKKQTVVKVCLGGGGRTLADIEKLFQSNPHAFRETTASPRSHMGDGVPGIESPKLFLMNQLFLKMCSVNNDDKALARFPTREPFIHSRRRGGSKSRSSAELQTPNLPHMVQEVNKRRC